MAVIVCKFLKEIHLILCNKFTMEVMKDYENADTISVDTLALEQMVIQERSTEITQLQALSKKARFLHSDLLYYRNAKTATGKACYNVWKVLIKRVGGTPNGWLDLGYTLGISQDDLNYIKHSVREDPVDMVLRVFRQDESATIDKILDAFVTLKRYDILKAIEEPLCEITQFFNKDDSGYHSNGESAGQREIICPKNVPNHLPPALNKKIVIKDQKDPKKPKQPLLRPPVTPKEVVVNESPILFLTYTYDGLPTAINIQEYVENWTDIPNVRVITLNSRKDDLYQNPEKFIREYFEKANLIIPIITTGYLDEIKSHDPIASNTTDNLDHKYVNFIYNLIVNNYIYATGCLNKKVRSVMPQNASLDLFNRLSMYPDLMPWTYEMNFDEQFQVFLKMDNSS
ncbi:unnamed protein product [Arctia plantaginis]|uniref:Death domain-containing protein n=1 Tax=Arctia plantaginis TaxID=874455 RepID=A0A8S0ZTD5_ARCPL|nr:unnamed protein product [Arctia plantaginis]